MSVALLEVITQGFHKIAKPGIVLSHSVREYRRKPRFSRPSRESAWTSGWMVESTLSWILPVSPHRPPPCIPDELRSL
jgi:hypothetical protein